MERRVTKQTLETYLNDLQGKVLTLAELMTLYEIANQLDGDMDPDKILYELGVELLPNGVYFFDGQDKHKPT